MKLVYPAIFSPWEDGDGYTVEVPDLPGCVTEGATLADAVLMAQDAASGWVLDELEEGRPAPAASAMEDIRADAGGLGQPRFPGYGRLCRKYGNTAVRKNCTIPAWLNTFAEARHINFSKVLTDGLTALYQAAT